MPKSVVVGCGEIVDGTGNRSGQQDIILYRSDFPMITSLTPVNTYLTEGVIATIEVKSDLSTGTPNHLCKAFQSASRVHKLQKQAYIVSGEPEQLEKLKEISSIKTYVVGYTGWKDEKALFSQYVNAGDDVSWDVPHLICQPGFCVLSPDRINSHRYLKDYALIEVGGDLRLLARRGVTRATVVLAPSWLPA